MAVGAQCVAVGLLQREGRLVVVEQGRLPASAVVAFGAAGNASSLRELRAVDVRVAVFTLLWRGMEINIRQLGFEVRGFVAVAAGDGAMRSGQREIRLGVVETREFRPGFIGVAGFASHRLAVHHSLHARSKLPAVRIGVTSRAGHILEVVLHCGFDLGRGRRRWLVTFLAGHGQMRSRQHESRLFVSRQAEGGRLVAIECVALLATVQIRGGGELRLVLVCVAVKAATELDLVERFFATGNVTLPTLQSGMLALQGIGGRRMLGQPKFRRLKPVHGVTGGALLTAHTLCKLSLVLVLVAVHTLLEGERLFEIALAMAGDTIHLLVLPQQRILGL